MRKKFLQFSQRNSVLSFEKKKKTQSFGSHTTRALQANRFDFVGKDENPDML